VRVNAPDAGEDKRPGENHTSSEVAAEGKHGEGGYVHSYVSVAGASPYNEWAK
jgi:hypothetical protein